MELSREFEELGDIPDRFMCPIGCDIMRDPVTLPTSGQVRSVESTASQGFANPAGCTVSEAFVVCCQGYWSCTGQWFGVGFVVRAELALLQNV